MTAHVVSPPIVRLAGRGRVPQLAARPLAIPFRPQCGPILIDSLDPAVDWLPA